MERDKFHSRNRKEDEGVAAYVAELRKLTEHCNLGESLPEMLRDRLVCGINNKKIQRRLLAERELTLKKAEEIALGEELAAKHVVDIQSETTPSSVNQVDAQDKTRKIVVQIQSVIVVGRNMKLQPVDSKMLSVLNVGEEGT